MPQIKITGYQEVYYEKVLDLDQDEYDELMSIEDEDDQKQWLADSDALPMDDDATHYGPLEDFTVTPFQYPA